MSKNRFWAPSAFVISMTGKSITISNSSYETYKLVLTQIDDYLYVFGSNYYNGAPIIFGSDETNFLGIIIQGSGTISGNGSNTLFNFG